MFCNMRARLRCCPSLERLLSARDLSSGFSGLTNLHKNLRSRRPHDCPQFTDEVTVLVWVSRAADAKTALTVEVTCCGGRRGAHSARRCPRKEQELGGPGRRRLGLPRSSQDGLTRRSKGSPGHSHTPVPTEWSCLSTALRAGPGWEQPPEVGPRDSSCALWSGMSPEARSRALSQPLRSPRHRAKGLTPGHATGRHGAGFHPGGVSPCWDPLPFLTASVPAAGPIKQDICGHAYMGV